MLKVMLCFVFLFSFDVSARGGHYKNHRKVVKLKVDKKKCQSPCSVKLSAKLNRHNKKNIKEFIFDLGDGNKVTTNESSINHIYTHTYKELPKFEWRSGNYWRELFRYFRYRILKRRTKFKWFTPSLVVVYNKGPNSRKSHQSLRVKGEILTDVKPPVLAENQNFEVNEDNVLSFTLKDAEGGEEGSLKYALIDSPSNGTLSECLNDTEDLTCKFTPNQNFNGEVSFSYKANDGKNDSNTGIVKINVLAVNDAPTLIASQSFTGKEDEAITFNLKNATDVDSTSFTYKLTKAPTSGELTNCLGDKELDCTFTPALNFNGDVEFSYVANDGESDSNESVVKLSVSAVNDAPTLIKTQSFEVDEDKELTISLASANDTDSSNLTYSIVSQVQNATLQNCLENGLSCTIKPNKDFNGDLTFSYKANDGELDSEISTVSIKVNSINDAPVIAEPLSITTDEDNSVQVDLKQATDVDSSELTYTIVSTPAEVSVSGCLKADDFICTLTPKKDFNGVVKLTFKANDRSLDSNVQDINLVINPINDAPVLSGTLNFEGDQNKDLTFSLLSATDIDSSNLSYKIIGSIDNGELKGCMDGNGLDCKFTPNKDFNGEVVFKYVANDGDKNSSEVTVTLNIKEVIKEDVYIYGASEIEIIQKSNVFERYSININNTEKYSREDLTFKLDKDYGIIKLRSDGVLVTDQVEDITLLPNKVNILLVDNTDTVVTKKSVNIISHEVKFLEIIKAGKYKEFVISNENSFFYGVKVNFVPEIELSEEVIIYEGKGGDGKYFLNIDWKKSKNERYYLSNLPKGYSVARIGNEFRNSLINQIHGRIRNFNISFEDLKDAVSRASSALTCFYSSSKIVNKETLDELIKSKSAYDIKLKLLSSKYNNVQVSYEAGIDNINIITDKILKIINANPLYYKFNYVFLSAGTMLKVGDGADGFVSENYYNTIFIDVSAAASQSPEELERLIIHEGRHIYQDLGVGCSRRNLNSNFYSYLSEADAEHHLIRRKPSSAIVDENGEIMGSFYVLDRYKKQKYANFISRYFGLDSYFSSYYNFRSKNTFKNDYENYLLRVSPYYSAHVFDHLNFFSVVGRSNRSLFFSRSSVEESLVKVLGSKKYYDFKDKLIRNLYFPDKRKAPVSFAFANTYNWIGSENIKPTYWTSSSFQKSYVSKRRGSELITIDYATILRKYGVLKGDETVKEWGSELNNIRVYLNFLKQPGKHIPYLSIGKTTNDVKILSDGEEDNSFTKIIDLNNIYQTHIVATYKNNIKYGFDLEAYVLTRKRFCSTNPENKLEVSITTPDDTISEPLNKLLGGSATLEGNKTCFDFDFPLGVSMKLTVKAEGGDHFSILCSNEKCENLIKSDEPLEQFEITSTRSNCIISEGGEPVKCFRFSIKRYDDVIIPDGGLILF